MKFFKKKVIPFRKKQTWEKIAKKYKEAPFFRIEDFAKYQELHFYQKTVRDPHITKYKMPLSITAIVFLSRFFPDDVDFFREELVKKFNLMRRYKR